MVMETEGAEAENTLEIVIERVAFDAGDLVEGAVILRVTKSIECQELSLLMEGTERAVWWEGRGDSARRCHRTNEFLYDKIGFLTADSYDPGEYSFSFSYRFHESLPSSFSFSDRSAGWMHHLSDSIAYSLHATLVVSTSPSTTLEATQPVELFTQQCARPVRPVSQQASAVIHTMSVVTRGECEVTAQLGQDVWVAGDLLLVQTSIHNRSTIDMASISLKLFEIVTFTRPARSGVQGSKCVCKAKIPGVRTGDQLEQVLSLPVTEDAILPASPTTSSPNFVYWTYKLVIKCEFVMSTGVQVEIPVVVLPRARPRHDAAVIVEAMKGGETSVAEGKPTP